MRGTCQNCKRPGDVLPVGFDMALTVQGRSLVKESETWDLCTTCQAQLRQVVLEMVAGLRRLRGSGRVGFG